MVEIHHRYPASAIALKERLAALDVLLLRRHVFPRGLQSMQDAGHLLALHRGALHRDESWDVWFVETLAAFLATQLSPCGEIDEDKAAAIVALFADRGVINDRAELEVVLHAAELADRVSDRLSAFLLDQLRLALGDGIGAFAQMRWSKRAGVAEEDMQFVYRILREACVGGRLLLTARQIAILEGIDRIVCGRANHPAWRRLMRSVVERQDDDHFNVLGWLNLAKAGAGLGMAA